MKNIIYIAQFVMKSFQMQHQHKFSICSPPTFFGHDFFHQNEFQNGLLNILEFYYNHSKLEKNNKYLLSGREYEF